MSHLLRSRCLRLVASAAKTRGVAALMKLVGVQSVGFCAVVLAVLLPARSLAQPVTFADGDFAAWTATEIFNDLTESAGFTAQREPTGGNPGAYRRTTHTLNGIGGLGVAHEFAGAVYDPSTQGPIAAIDFSYDLINLNNVAVVAYRLMILQEGTYYNTQNDVIPRDTGWSSFSHTALAAEDFFRFVGEGPLRPDFSANGALIQLGIITANSNPQVHHGTRNHGVDNFSVTIIPLGVPVIRVTPRNTSVLRSLLSSFKVTVMQNGSPVADFPFQVRADAPIFDDCATDTKVGRTDANGEATIDIKNDILRCTPGSFGLRVSEVAAADAGKGPGIIESHLEDEGDPVLWFLLFVAMCTPFVNPDEDAAEFLDVLYELAQFVEGKSAPEIAEILLGLEDSLGLDAIADLAHRRLDAGRGKTRAPRTGRADRNAELPLAFEVNQGQTDRSVDYLARGPGYNLFLNAEEAVVTLDVGLGRLADVVSEILLRKPSLYSSIPSPTIRMKLVEANPAARPSGLQPLPGRSHYLMGSDPDAWHTDIPLFERVKYESVYPGVDLIYYGRRGRLEYDFIVAPGRTHDPILLAFEGVEGLQLDDQGDLVLLNGPEELRLEKPVVYQEIAGLRREIAGGYFLDERNQVGFEIGQYDEAHPLIIDPVFSYSSYLGGGGNDVASAVAVDSQGNAYLTGGPSSPNFPGTIPPSAFAGGGILGMDGFVTKMNADGTDLVYSVYFGGSLDDLGISITVDGEGAAYVTGATRSADFPTQNPVQGDFGGGGDLLKSDAFALKLRPDGSGLVYSTYLGGSGDDGARGIAVDSESSAYIVGSTSSLNFPIAAPLQAANNGGGPMGSDAFVTKLSADGGSMIYSTYLGGSEDDLGMGIAVDAAGNAYVTGGSRSADFPVAGAFQQESGGASDAFLAKINAAGSVLLYSSLLGGESDDYGMGVALDAESNAYITGLTGSEDFPTVEAAQPDFGQPDGLGADAFVTKVNAAGSEIVYSTFLGGSDLDAGAAIAVAAEGNAYITGETSSIDFPTLNAIQPAPGGSLDGFVAKLTADGSSFEFCTYPGGSGLDTGSGIALDAQGGVYVTAGGSSFDQPVTFGAFQTSSAGAVDALVAKIVEGDPLPKITTVSARQFQRRIRRRA